MGETRALSKLGLNIKSLEWPLRETDGPREWLEKLYNLLYGGSDSKDAPPLIPTDTLNGGPDIGYKRLKAKLGLRKVRPWIWMKFVNPARNDGLILRHWRRAADEGKDYPFSRFNKA
ncbi:DMAP1 [Lepeophtheirus salmonis]|uniref:DMAP1 n=1 Tax=Lepeophtheirus salmonis TaxID=72036 RepID=A0A7R8HAA6_LEPSM|nr:DMAP1 [Lepeophtheirus salmonis]CAF2968982.1 DMAP1 [Lepeophtheirus salmonis]